VLAELVRLGIRPVAYLTPINVQRAERVAGAGLARRIRENASAIVRACAARGVDVLDATELAGEREFIDCLEHMTHAGRAALAALLAPRVERELAAASDARAGRPAR
jgi:hypothetical protein